MSFRDVSPAQLAVVQAMMQSLREQLLAHAREGAANAGFTGDRQAQTLAVMMTLMGAAQLAALEDRRLYAVFRALAQDMANSTADAPIARRLDDLGPEIFSGMGSA